MNKIVPVIIDKLTVNLDGKVIINDLSLQVDRGEIVAIMGLNGAGKTTLIKSLVGLIPQTEGNISVFGCAPTQATTREKFVYLPEKFSVAKNIKAMEFLNLFNLDQTQIFEVAEKVMLAQKALQNPIRSFSKGMLQKLGLVYFFAQNKQLMIADEIMSGLDYKTRDAVQNLIIEKNSQDHTLIFSTHHSADVEGTCARLVYIENGSTRTCTSRQV